jgi:hypothetical protein
MSNFGPAILPMSLAAALTVTNSKKYCTQIVKENAMFPQNKMKKWIVKK